MFRFRVWCGLAFLFSLAITGCEPPGNEVEADDQQNRADAAAENREDDDFAQNELLSDPKQYEEAKQWLDPKHVNHKLWKMERDFAVKMVDDFYNAGAAKVYACGERDDGEKVHIVATFVVELPQDPARRKRIFEVNREMWRKLLEDDEELPEYAAIDTGQKYIVLNFDL